MRSDFFKENPKDKIWWVNDLEKIGSYLFSFDKKTVFDFWSDYPHKLTPEQVEIFKRENPELAELKG